MPRAERTVTIARPPEEVFEFLAAGENNPKWRSGVPDIALAKGRADAVGAVWRQGAIGPMGRRVDADYEVTIFEPARRLGFKVVAGPARPEGLYELEPADGGTRLRFVLSWEPTGLKKLLMSGMVQKTMEVEVGALEELKRVLEGS